MEPSISSIRRPFSIEEDDGLASLAEIEAGFSGNQVQSYGLSPRPLCFARRSSFRSLSSPSSYFPSPRSASARFYDARFEDHQSHFLDACFLCKKPLGDNKDIFMYRGDTPFCSEECRHEQIERDEMKEKSRNISSSMKVLRNKEQKKSPPTEAQDYPFRTGTVAAA